MYNHNYNFFREQLEMAQAGCERATEVILRRFATLIKKYRYVWSTPDEDLLSEQWEVALMCIRRFKCDENDMEEFLGAAAKILVGDEMAG